jgi:diacylglycerol O-acyltransferase / wax synthase
MQRLSGTDALFLSMETPSWHQHVGGFTVLEGEVDFDRFMEVISERIAYAPKFRWKLKHVPLGLDRPIWVDDPDFDVARHVGRVGVPTPGGRREVADLAGTLLSTQLDRRRPLWEMWWLEGIAGGKTGLLMKYHHCLLDGVAGAGLATALLDLERDPLPGTSLVPLPTEEESRAGDAPSDLELVVRGALEAARRPARTARYLAGAAAKGVAALGKVSGSVESRSLPIGPPTPFNATVGPRRSLAFASVSLDDVKRVKKTHEVKLNDVVLALCGSALRAYLDGTGELPDTPLVSAVPVSIRQDGDTTQDNQLSSMFVSLATTEADPVERLLAIARSSTNAKELASAAGARRLPSLGEVASPLMLGAAINAAYRAQVMSRAPLRVNTVVSNVAGPPMDLYLCGAKVTGMIPCSVILEGVGVNFTAISNGDRLDVGLHADPDLVPDPWAIAEAVPAALAELLEASDLGEPTPVQDPFDAQSPGRAR